MEYVQVIPKILQKEDLVAHDERIHGLDQYFFLPNYLSNNYNKSQHNVS